MNSVHISGNLTRDPELRYTPDGKAVANFTVASNEGSGENKKATFVRIVAWEKTAENVAQYKKKGDPVLVDGRLSFRSYTDKEGQKRESFEVIANRVEFLSNGKATPLSEAAPPPAGEEVPF